jgi:hypothetical protein
MRMVTVIIVLGSLLLCAAPALAQSQGRVIRDGTIIWRADASLIATTAKAGTIVEITARSDGWYEVIIPDALGGHGQRGRIAVSQVQLIPGSPEPPLREFRGRGPAPQTPRSKAPFGTFLSVNGGYQLTSNDFRDSGTQPENGEVRQFDSSYSVTSGPIFDVAVGALVSQNWGIGVGVSRFARSTPTTLSGSTPHPFFFNQPRSVSADVGGLNRREFGVHVQARGAFPIGTHLQVMLFGGPSFFQVKQDTVKDFTYTHAYPYDAVTFSAAQTSPMVAWKIGFNGGGDVAFFFMRQIGIGFSATFSGTTIDVPSASGSTIPVKVGGMRAGVGLRLRF